MYMSGEMWEIYNLTVRLHGVAISCVLTQLRLEICCRISLKVVALNVSSLSSYTEIFYKISHLAIKELTNNCYNCSNNILLLY